MKTSMVPRLICVTSLVVLAGCAQNNPVSPVLGARSEMGDSQDDRVAVKKDRVDRLAGECITFTDGNTSTLKLLSLKTGDVEVLAKTMMYSDRGANNSRGGEVFVYSSPDGVRKMDMDGSNNRVIFPLAFYPRWSWNGKYIAAGIYGFPDHIVVMDGDGTLMNDLASTGGGHDEYPCWTPDHKIIYRHYQWQQGGAIAAIMIMNADGTDRQVVKAFSTPYVFPTDCSANGKILFDSSLESNRYCVFSINRDGTGMTNLTKDSMFEARNAKFSKDGRKIVFNTYQLEVYVMDADGDNKTFVTYGENPYFVY